jgi:hypothetical protein
VGPFYCDRCRFPRNCALIRTMYGISHTIRDCLEFLLEEIP